MLRGAMELGLATFADIGTLTPQQRMRNLIEEGELAEQLGLDVFAIGEHHRRDFLISAPVVPLAAIAARTQRIRLASAVTVLSSDDPVRVLEQFATLDLLSDGRGYPLGDRDGSYLERRDDLGQRGEYPVRRGADDSDGGVSPAHRGSARSARRSRASRTSWSRPGRAERLR